MTYSTTIVSLACLNVLFALSMYITFAIGQFSLAQVGFWAMGAYLSAILTTLFGWPLWGAVPAAGAVCALIGLVLGYPCLRLRGFYLALATLGFSETVRVLFQNLEFQMPINGVPVGPSGILGFRNVAVTTGLGDIAAFLVGLVLLLAWMARSRIGLAVAAVRDDDTVARFMGIDIVLAKVAAFMFAAAVAGMGGALYAGFTSYISPDEFGFHMTLLGILFVAIGGTGSFLGPILAAAVLTVLPEFFRFLAEYRMIFYGGLVILLMTLRPRGLIDDRFASAMRRAFTRKPA